MPCNSPRYVFTCCTMAVAAALFGCIESVLLIWLYTVIKLMGALIGWREGVGHGCAKTWGVFTFDAKGIGLVLLHVALLGYRALSPWER